MNSLWDKFIFGFCVIGALGLLRMPDFFTRMLAASLIDTLGLTLSEAALLSADKVIK